MSTSTTDYQRGKYICDLPRGPSHSEIGLGNIGRPVAFGVTRAKLDFGLSQQALRYGRNSPQADPEFAQDAVAKRLGGWMDDEGLQTHPVPASRRTSLPACAERRIHAAGGR